MIWPLRVRAKQVREERLETLRVGDPGCRHPYVDYETDILWPLIEQGIDDLVKNHDLIEQTGRDHIVGFLCKAILKGQKNASTLPRSSVD